jgi:hypothetical protein
MSKSENIRNLLDRGWGVERIANTLKVDRSLIYVVRSNYKKAKKKAAKQAKKQIPKIEAEVRDVKAAMDFLGTSKITTRNFTKAEIEALGGKDVFNTLGTDDEVQKALDRVNSPPHYTTGGIETIDFIEAKDLNYRLGNVIKYVSRAEKKANPLEDLKKAKWYLEREISTRERA